MAIFIKDIEQNSPEWDALKIGIPSSSKFDNIVMMSGERSKQAKKYMYRLAVERITGKKLDTYQNAAMQRGLEMEQEAVELYEFISGNKTEKVGVVYPDKKKSCLASPDRLILGEKQGVLEVKCPEAQTHVEYLLNKKLPSTYFQQVQGQLYVTGFEYAVFMSYFPGVQPFIIEIARDEDFIKALDEQMQVFCSELSKVVEQVKTM